MFQKKSKWECLKVIAANLEEADKAIMLGLVGMLEKKKRISEEESEEYVDFLLGVAAEVDEEEQESIYRVVEMLQE